MTDLGTTTPSPWAWRNFSGQMMLVADHGRRKVILCAAGKSRGRYVAGSSPFALRPTEVLLATCEERTGRLIDVNPDLPDMRLIAAAPEFLFAAQQASVLLEAIATCDPLDAQRIHMVRENLRRLDAAIQGVTSDWIAG